MRNCGELWKQLRAALVVLFLYLSVQIIWNLDLKFFLMRLVSFWTASSVSKIAQSSHPPLQTSNYRPLWSVRRVRPFIGLSASLSLCLFVPKESCQKLCKLYYQTTFFNILLTISSTLYARRIWEIRLL